MSVSFAMWNVLILTRRKAEEERLGTRITFKYEDQFLGKGFNGLLPRRARLEDLTGKDGWQDLAWLLELNQGFYNAASLAAVCSLAEFKVPSYRWWGKPIAPAERNERLEPLVTAIRDGRGLYTNDELKGIRNLIKYIWLGAAFRIFRAAVYEALDEAVTRVVNDAENGKSEGTLKKILVLTLRGVTVFYFILDLVASTVYVVREGWIYVDTSSWHDAAKKLKEQDPTLTDIKHWSDEQLCPKWDSPQEVLREHEKGIDHKCWSAFLVDIQSKVVVPTTVINRPNELVIIALLGCGVTCMLLNRPEGKGNTIASKVEMANLPTLHKLSNRTQFMWKNHLLHKKLKRFMIFSRLIIRFSMFMTRTWIVSMGTGHFNW